VPVADGGHGDWREPHHEHAPIEGIRGLVAMPRICDSPDAMRLGAREMLRMGAHGVKIMAGGGCMSPTDELEHTQFTHDEIAAAAYEARTVGKICLAHVYTPRGIMNAVRAGVRSIEHGNFLDEESAACMREAGAFFVPTLTTYELISAFGAAQGISRRNIEKIDQAKVGGLESLRVALAPASRSRRVRRPRRDAAVQGDGARAQGEGPRRACGDPLGDAHQREALRPRRRDRHDRGREARRPAPGRRRSARRRRVAPGRRARTARGARRRRDEGTSIACCRAPERERAELRRHAERVSAIRTPGTSCRRRSAIPPSTSAGPSDSTP
jgi:hypothetical protein